MPDGILTEGLQSNIRLTDLYLSGNNIGFEGAQAIGKALQSNTALTKLNFSDNNIDYKSIYYLLTH